VPLNVTAEARPLDVAEDTAGAPPLADDTDDDDDAAAVLLSVAED
jgi:hypothetical protein